MKTPLVSICCLCYNHEKFIRQCIEGFLIQKVNFDIEIIINDDASQDDSVRIITEYQSKYPNLFVCVFQKENQYSKGVNLLSLIFSKARGKYIAYCEGDDYWTDPLKLQKQVDFLENNQEYIMCSHSFLYLDNGSQKLSYYYNNEFKNDIKYDLNYYISYKLWLTQIMTMLYRKEGLDPDLLSRYSNAKDVTICYCLLKNGSGYFMNENMSVYRRHSQGVWSGLDSGKQKISEINAILGIYLIERDNVAAQYLLNCLNRTGYWGVLNVMRNAPLLCKIIKIIHKHYGLNTAFNVLKRACIL